MAYTKEELDLIFSKASWMIGWPEWGVDRDGRIIRRSAYGTLTTYGWQVDHIAASALGGSDALFNLRPRHWLGNSQAGGILSKIGR